MGVFPVDGGVCLARGPGAAKPGAVVWCANWRSMSVESIKGGGVAPVDGGVSLTGDVAEGVETSIGWLRPTRSDTTLP